MKRILSTTALISLVLTSAQPWPLMAQEAPACVPGADGACVPPDQQAADQQAAEAAARAEAEAKAAAEEAARQEAAAAEDAARKAAEAEAQAAAAAAEAARQDAEAQAAAAEEAAKNEAAAQAAAEEAAQRDAAAQAAAQAEADAKAAADAAAAAEEAARKEAEAKAAADAAPAAEAAPSEAPAAEVAPDVAADPAPVAEPPATEPTAAEPAATEPPAAEPPAAEPPAVDTPAVEAAPEPAPEQPAALTAEEEAVRKAAEDAARLAQEQAAAAAAAPPPPPVEAPVVAPEVSQNLDTLIGAAPTEAATPPVVAASAPEAAGNAAPAAPAIVSETQITAADTRSSAQEFAPPPQQLADSKKSGLSDLERAGLFALGALVLGKVMTGGQEVVANSGDRVVVRDPDGGYQLYKDDDSLLRRPGSTLRNESYSDGSSRTVVDREDGSRVVTLRDASGRVLRRTQIDRNGREYVLIDDLRPFDRVDVSTLPKVRPQNFVASNDRGDQALAAALARQQAVKLDRSFSLQQIRDIPQVRHLAAAVDVDQVTFASGSSVIRPSEAPKLASLGRLMQQMLADNPREIFLIEGHTDAVGSAASNLTLSDRRAESLALALTEYYRVPPENMVVQGYGEAELRVPTESAEPANRRAAVRLITPLMYAQR